MIVRRLVALLTSVTMLHLSLVAVDSACASHGHGTNGHHAATANATGTSAYAMPMNGHAMPIDAVAARPAATATPTTTADMPPCELPAQEQCCVALVGCSIASAITSTYHGLDSATRPLARISDALLQAPPSLALAPEPPPPKA